MSRGPRGAGGRGSDGRGFFGRRAGLGRAVSASGPGRLRGLVVTLRTARYVFREGSARYHGTPNSNRGRVLLNRPSYNGNNPACAPAPGRCGVPRRLPTAPLAVASAAGRCACGSHCRPRRSEGRWLVPGGRSEDAGWCRGGINSVYRWIHAFTEYATAHGARVAGGPPTARPSRVGGAAAATARQRRHAPVRARREKTRRDTGTDEQRPRGPYSDTSLKPSPAVYLTNGVRPRL